MHRLGTAHILVVLIFHREITMKKIIIILLVLLFSAPASATYFKKVHTYGGDFGGDIWYVSDVDGADTNGTSGDIHFHVVWRPLSDDGFLEPAS